MKENMTNILVIILIMLLFMNMYARKSADSQKSETNYLSGITSKIQKHFDRSSQIKLINGQRLNDLNDLYSALETINDDIFKFHQQKQDYSRWVSDTLGFKSLGHELKFARNQKHMRQIMVSHFKK